MAQSLAPLLHDGLYYRKFRLLGLRKVLEEHTYEDRLSYMAHKIWGILPGKLPHVHILARAGNASEFDRILAAYNRQSYVNKSLIVVLEDSSDADLPEDSTIHIYSPETAQKKTVGDVAIDDFVAGFVCCDYYGPNYLMDTMLATRYSSAPVIGKGGWYKEQTDGVQIHDEWARYSYVDKLPLRSCAFLATLRTNDSLVPFLEQLLVGEIQGEKCLSIDEFNYCRDCTAVACAAVDDLQEVNCGRPLSELVASI